MITLSAATILHAQTEASAHDIEEAAQYLASSTVELQNWMKFVNTVMARAIAIANAPKIVDFHVVLADSPIEGEVTTFQISFDEQYATSYKVIQEDGTVVDQQVTNPMLIAACQRSFKALPDAGRQFNTPYYLSVAPITDRPIDETSVQIPKGAVTEQTAVEAPAPEETAGEEAARHE